MLKVGSVVVSRHSTLPTARQATSALSMRIHGPQVGEPAGSSSVVCAQIAASQAAPSVPSMSGQSSIGVVRSSIRSRVLTTVMAICAVRRTLVTAPKSSPAENA